jgi:inhibitor of cysteine peptidase
MSLKKGSIYLNLLLTFILMGAGCNTNVSNVTITSTPPELGPTEVMIDSVEIRELESFPVQIVADVKGYVAKCAKIGEPMVKKDGNTFKINFDVVLGTVCAQKNASISFDKSVNLEVYGLKKGTYIVDVQGNKKEFTLSMDNILEENK